MPLTEGTSISLGQVKLNVTKVSTGSIPATILMPPHPGHHHHSPTPPAPALKIYGLECPECHKVSPGENLQIGCHWCGTSLAAAVSVLVAPGSREKGNKREIFNKSNDQ